MHHDGERVPIVEPGTFELAVVDPKPERLDQVERAAGGGAQPRHVAGVGRDLGLDEEHVQRRLAHGVERDDALARLRRHRRTGRRAATGSAVLANATSSSVRARGATRYATPPCVRNTRSSAARGYRVATAGCAGSLTITSAGSTPRTTSRCPSVCSSGAPGSSPARQPIEIAPGKPASTRAAT